VRQGGHLASDPAVRRLIDNQRKIIERLERVERTLAQVLEAVRPKGLDLDKVAGGKEVLLKVPAHLRKTLMALFDLGEATASEVAPKTGRTRGLESIYLNQLARMKVIEKFRKGRKVLFRLAKYL